MVKSHNKTLHVIATKEAHVIPIGAVNQGQVQFVGKTFNTETKEFDIIKDGVIIQYHPEYIKYLKEGSLIAATLETAVLANVSLLSFK